MPQTPYSPEHFPRWVFPVKKNWRYRSKRFAAIEKLKEKSKRELLALPESALQKRAFRGLEKTLA